MGRRKIDIVRIDNERHRQVTYTKRKSGLIKKATELAILCDAQVAVIIFNSSQKMSVYSSHPMEQLVSRYRSHNDQPEVRAGNHQPLSLSLVPEEFCCFSPRRCKGSERAAAERASLLCRLLTCGAAAPSLPCAAHRRLPPRRIIFAIGLARVAGVREAAPTTTTTTARARREATRRRRP